ncbi:uncharacterized protein JCM6883_006677 [Sporobolomyces salmoneus]|uniref:uncharacterized protein n=1 Tax=Sporobolomyces salmoneus TaxID=183962 RepID=UPI0031737776
MPPTTPRTASNVYTSTTATPRSARRLATAQVSSSGTPSRVPLLSAPDYPALAPLNTKRYPSIPYADDPDFSSLLQQDMDSVDSACEILTTMIDHRKRSFRSHLTELESERTSYESRIRELGEVAKENVRIQGKEREEMEKTKRNLGEVGRQQEKLRVRMEGYQQEVREVEGKVKRRMDLKARQLEAFNAQLVLNKPELDFFERYLGVKIRGKGHDVVQFKFVRLDRTSYSRTFSFELDVSTSYYSLSSMTPPHYLPPKFTAELIESLNRKKLDFYQFVRFIRTGFCVEIEVEKRLGGSTGTGGAAAGGGDEAREREREKVWTELEGRG